MGNHSLLQILFVLPIAAAAIVGNGCDSESITEIDPTDTLQVEFIEGDASYSTFQIRIKTTSTYGCDGQIAYRFNHNKSQEIVFDIIGVESGNGQCDRSATSRTEAIDYTTQRKFKLEIRKQKKVTRYLIYRNGSQWSDSLIISDIPSDFHFIEEGTLQYTK